MQIHICLGRNRSVLNVDKAASTLTGLSLDRRCRQREIKIEDNNHKQTNKQTKIVSSSTFDGENPALGSNSVTLS